MTLFNDKDSKSSQNIRNNCCVEIQDHIKIKKRAVSA